MRGNHPGEGKREQQPEKTQPAPALGPKWSSPVWEQPWHHSGLGGSCGSTGLSHSQLLIVSSRMSHSTSVPRIGRQIRNGRSGMFSLSLECCTMGWQCWQHPGNCLEDVPVLGAPVQPSCAWQCCGGPAGDSHPIRSCPISSRISISSSSSRKRLGAALASAASGKGQSRPHWTHTVTGQLGITSRGLSLAQSTLSLLWRHTEPFPPSLCQAITSAQHYNFILHLNKINLTLFYFSFKAFCSSTKRSQWIWKA